MAFVGYLRGNKQIWGTQSEGPPYVSGRSTADPIKFVFSAR